MNESTQGEWNVNKVSVVGRELAGDLVEIISESKN